MEWDVQNEMAMHFSRCTHVRTYAPHTYIHTYLTCTYIHTSHVNTYLTRTYIPHTYIRTSSSLNQERLSEVRTNQYSLELPLMRDTWIPSQPLRMIWFPRALADLLESFPLDALYNNNNNTGWALNGVRYHWVATAIKTATSKQ